MSARLTTGLPTRQAPWAFFSNCFTDGTNSYYWVYYAEPILFVFTGTSCAPANLIAYEVIPQTGFSGYQCSPSFTGTYTVTSGQTLLYGAGVRSIATAGGYGWPLCFKCIQAIPMSVPGENIQVSWTSSGTFGSGSATCVYNSGSHTWISPCIAGSGVSMKYQLTVSGFTLVVGWIVYTGTSCGTVSYNKTLTIGAYSENPFHLPCSMTGVPWTTYGFSSVSFDDAAQSLPCSLPVLFTVYGCSSIALAGATVTLLWGATVINSGTTDGSGQVTIDTTGYDTSVCTLHATMSRFTNYSGAATVNPITMSAASGYTCCNFGGSDCPQPLANTLNCTFVNAGAQVFTYASSYWTASFTYLSVAYVIKLDNGGSIIATAGGTGFTCSFNLTSCPPSFGATISVPGSGLGSAIGYGTLTE